MSRGRGGGRGGRGAARAFNREQMNAIGLSNNEIRPLVTQPPPLFPLIDRRPVPFAQTVETDYLLILRQDFVDHMQLSSAYLRMPETSTTKPEQEIDKLVAQLPNKKEKYDWSLFPTELRPKMLAKRIKKKPVENKEVDIQERLKALEQIESKGNVEIKEEAVEDEETEELEELEQDDEEMDDGTDYANNYFDNGEGYEDDDDNMDEGPIY